MSTNIRFVVYNAYGIGGTVKTIFNFADYLQLTGKYSIEIISIKRNQDVTTLPLNKKITITVIQDSRRGAKYSEDDRILLSQPSKLIHPDEDLYPMFNGYTDKRLIEQFSKIHDGVLVTTMPSLNALAVDLVDEKVLKIGQEHKSYADHTPGIQKMIREKYQHLDALTILTEKNKRIYSRKIPGNLPIYVLGNGTPMCGFRANLKNHVIIGAGRYAEEKGYDMLIRAFSLIADRFPDWVVKIYGNGNLAPYYVEVARECGVENQIVLENGTDKLGEKLSEAAIHVCSSYREAFGMVVIEGFAMGIPCVSFACDGPSEIITDGYDGLLVPREDIQGLANAMERVMSDEEFRLELGKNAYNTAKKYDIKAIGSVLERIISDEMMNKKKRPPEKVNVKTISIEKTNNELQSIVEQKEETAEWDYSYYERICTASEKGQIGLKTILKMLLGWMRYKVSVK